MEVFSRSKYDCYYADDSTTFDADCRVRMDAEMLVVEYEEDDGIVTYRGHAMGEGHYQLKAVGFDGKATLHRVPGGKILEGSWIEENQAGMWRITLVA